ncbi:hypothetical protein HCN51_21955 [Nonomuraea sp. FMUSA5-5]|uniref:Uncharacterized protein n=1 Tax=Nonomuraea composti TaxID=2720023 RepID=A0ABX1B2N7_9ACTN|nr:hypothetical protein [Nonomuraea sp. FMUSA5-5]NJP92095.1 hypothetical protein [Nonomuraea sp. FMUSA5-5]
MRTVALKDRVPLGPMGPLGVLVDPMTWWAVPYLLVSGVVGLAWYFVLAVHSPVGGPTVVRAELPCEW